MGGLELLSISGVVVFVLDREEVPGLLLSLGGGVVTSLLRIAGLL